MYKLEITHRTNDFSGILIWNRHFNASLNASLLISTYNIYKCHYKQDIIPSKETPPQHELEYAQTYCIFGYESSLFETPALQSLFSTKRNYFAALMRSWLYGNSNPISYRQNVREAKIPNVVHLIWFGQRFKGLKFIEYLCLKSILYVLKPDKVKIHGDIEPGCELWKSIKQNSKVEWVHLDRPLIRY
jgi:hypothetical protein